MTTTGAVEKIFVHIKFHDNQKSISSSFQSFLLFFRKTQIITKIEFFALGEPLVVIIMIIIIRVE